MQHSVGTGGTPKPGVLQGITAENNDVKTSENANAKSNNAPEKQGIFPTHTETQHSSMSISTG